MAFDFKQLDTKLAGAKEWLTREYQSLRTGRASPAILDSVKVSAYGSLMPLNQVATVRIEGARSLVVQPFDTSLAKDIERGLIDADLGVGVASDSAGIRVSFPELTSERREQLIKIAKSKLEEARTTVRGGRDECWKEIQDQEKEGGITEDDKFRLKDEMQKKVDAMNDELQQLFEKKETEMQS